LTQDQATDPVEVHRCPRPWKNAWCEVSDVACCPAVTVETPL
jgi:hypothetical protein